MRSISALVISSLVVAAVGCGGNGSAPDDGLTTVVLMPVNLNRNVDLLFVIDNSGSMAEAQNNLTNAFPRMINELDTIEGGLPDVHIGIVSSNVGTGGVNIGGCSSASRPQGDDGNLLTNGCVGLTGQFISDIKQADGSRMTNYSGDLATLFTCMARLGTAGCGFEQHLDSMYRALQAGKNPGFLRQDAMLAIVILGDEDDCSAKDGGSLFGDPNGTITSPLGPRTSFRCHEFGVACDNDPNPRAFGRRTGCAPRRNSQYMKDVQPYVDYVKSLKVPGVAIVVATITGDVDVSSAVDVVPDPDDATRPAIGASCMAASGTATPAVRLHAFADAFGGSTPSICNDNLGDTLGAVAAQIHDHMGNPCIAETLADTDAATAGLQPRCVVTDFLDDGSGVRTGVIDLPACGGGVTPCWQIAADAVRCPSAPGNQSIQVDRGGASVPLGTFVEARCEVAR